MKGYYRIYVQRVSAPCDWEMVGASDGADEAHASAMHWEQNPQIVAVRVDVCVRYWDRSTVGATSSGSARGDS